MDNVERSPEQLARLLDDLDIIICLNCSTTSIHRRGELFPRGHQGCGGAWKVVREPQARKALMQVMARTPTENA